MSHRFAYGIAVLLAAVALLVSFCTELPLDPAQDPSNASIRLILEKGEEPIVENGTVKKIALNCT